MVISGLVGWLSMREHLYSTVAREAQEKANKIQEVINALALEHQKHHPGNRNFNTDMQDVLTYTITQEGTSVYHGSFVQLTSLNGKVFARSPNLGQTSLPLKPTQTPEELTLAFPKQTAIHTLYFNKIIEVNGQPLVTAQVALPLSETERLLNQMLLYRLMEMLVVMGIALLLGNFLSSWALAPIISMAEEVGKRQGKDISKPLNSRHLSPDEVGQLARTFNGLLAEIAEMVERERRFVADASHELRSPLTSIQGYAQLLLKRGFDNPELAKESLLTIAQEAQRLSQMVEDLLLLAQSEDAAPPMEQIELPRLCQQLAQDLNPLHPQLRFAENSDSVSVWGYEGSLCRVLRNLVDNALRVVGPEGTVSIHCYASDNWGVVEIRDNGVGIPAEHIPHIFERFYRVDPARTRENGGSGLGLAICREIVEMHQGTLTVLSQPNQGSCFSVKLPLAEEQSSSLGSARLLKV